VSSLGRYELLEKLGEGGMGAVWLGRLTGEGGFEKLCIIKTVLPAIAKDQQFVSRFLHEGRVLTQLQHSNIAQVFDMGREGETLYLALEYVPGVDLSNLSLHLRNLQQAFPVPVAVYLIQQVAEGLGFAHRKTATDGSPLRIVHRDVSPQNVMISFEGEVKVIDFGIAKSEGRSHATATASVMGKLGYMAPEQARGEPVDARADQYACGVLLWELLTSTSFVPRGTMTEMVVAMAHPVIRPLAPLRADVPASLEQVVLKALAADPEQRFATTDDFAAALMTELLGLSGLPTKRQVGEWVQANCPSDFKANQALLTRISLSKATVTDDGSTFVRTPTAPLPSAPGAVPSTAEVEKLAVPSSKAPLIIAAVLVLMAAAAGVVFMMRPGPTSAPAPVPAPAVVTLISAARVVDVFDDQGAVFVRAGTAEGLRVGESIKLVGAAEADGRRPLLGHATVLEAFEAMARVNLGELRQRPLFAALQARAAAVPRPVEPEPEPKPEVPVPPPPPPDSVETATPAHEAKAAIDAGLEAPVAALTFRGRLTMEGHVILTSLSPRRLTGCVMILAGQRVAKLGAVIPLAGIELPPNRFAVDSSVERLSGRGGVVKCDQGRGSVRL